MPLPLVIDAFADYVLDGEDAARVTIADTSAEPLVPVPPPPSVGHEIERPHFLTFEEHEVKSGL